VIISVPGVGALVMLLLGRLVPGATDMASKDGMMVTVPQKDDFYKIGWEIRKIRLLRWCWCCWCSRNNRDKRCWRAGENGAHSSIICWRKLINYECNNKCDTV